MFSFPDKEEGELGLTWLRGRFRIVDPLNLIQVILAEEISANKHNLVFLLILE
jgi:hypothetical protein